MKCRFFCRVACRGITDAACAGCTRRAKTHALFQKSRQVEVAAGQRIVCVYCRPRRDGVQSAPAERDAARRLQFQSRGTVPREIETLRRNAMRTNHLLATAGLAAML